MRFLKAVWTATWRISLFLVLWGVLLAPGIVLVDGGDRESGAALAPSTRLAVELLGVLAVVAAAWVVVRFIDRRPLAGLGFARAGALPDVLLGFAVGTAMIGLAVAGLALAGFVQRVPVRDFSWSTLGVMGAAMLLNSATQEILVRGYVLQTIETQLGTRSAVVVSSLFFTALHAGAVAEGGAIPAVNLFAAGLLLGLSYTTTRNLWMPIALHFAWNFLQGPVLGIAVSGQSLDGGWRLLELTGPEPVTGGAFGLEGGLVATVVTALGIGAVVAIGRRRRRSFGTHRVSSAS